MPKRLWLLPFLIASCSADASPTQHYSLGQDAYKFDSEIVRLRGGQWQLVSDRTVREEAR